MDLAYVAATEICSQNAPGLMDAPTANLQSTAKILRTATVGTGPTEYHVVGSELQKGRTAPTMFTCGPSQ